MLYWQHIRLGEVGGKLTAKPEVCIARQKSKLENEAAGLKRLVHAFITGEQRQVGYYESLCRMMSPLNILKKGFAIVYREDKFITDASGVEAGSDIKVRLLDSELGATVKHKKEKDGNEFDL